MPEQDIEPDGQYASKEEVAKALRALTDAEHKKLMTIAVSYWRSRRLLDRTGQADELLSEAVLATLRGDKKWRRKNVSLVKHLDQAMRNISGHWARKGLHETVGRAEMEADVAGGSQGGDIVRRTAVARDEMEFVRGLFAGDGAAMTMLDLKSRDITKSEICKHMGISVTEYDAIYKRVYRKLSDYVYRNQEVQNVR